MFDNTSQRVGKCDSSFTLLGSHFDLGTKLGNFSLSDWDIFNGLWDFEQQMLF